MYSADRVISDITTVSHNFVCGNKIFINEAISVETCSYMLADLMALISDPSTNDISFFINSPGGDFNVMVSIIGCIKLAKMKHLQVATYVMGEAGSASSMIATFGDENLRFINSYAQHFIHFGSYPSIISKESEIKKVNIEMSKFHNICKQIYTKNTKIPAKMLDKLMEDEQGYLDAKQCIKYKVADIII